MTYETENAEVRRLWEASGRKARVQCRSEQGYWSICCPPAWTTISPYRIHPDDLHLCHPVMAEAFRQREEQYAKMRPATQDTIDKLVTGSDKQFTPVDAHPLTKNDSIINLLLVIDALERRVSALEAITPPVKTPPGTVVGATNVITHPEVEYWVVDGVKGVHAWASSYDYANRLLGLLETQGTRGLRIIKVEKAQA